METTRDAFLNGRVTALQPRKGYRAGIDAVLLAASCPARAGDQVLELGCGVGVPALCLLARVADIAVQGVEKQPAYADLARQNAAGLNFRVATADITDLPKDIRETQYDHAIINPPYYDPNKRTAGLDQGREDARAEDTPLDRWIDIALRRVKPRGTLSIVHLTARLPDILGLLATRSVSVETQPLAPRRSRASHLVLVRAVKNGKSPFILHAPKFLHAAAQHDTDQEDYTPEFKAIFRDAAEFTFGD